MIQIVTNSQRMKACFCLATLVLWAAFSPVVFGSSYESLEATQSLQKKAVARKLDLTTEASAPKQEGSGSSLLPEWVLTEAADQAASKPGSSGFSLWNFTLGNEQQGQGNATGDYSNKADKEDKALSLDSLTEMAQKFELGYSLKFNERVRVGFSGNFGQYMLNRSDVFSSAPMSRANQEYFSRLGSDKLSWQLNFNIKL